MQAWISCYCRQNCAESAAAIGKIAADGAGKITLNQLLLQTRWWMGSAVTTNKISAWISWCCTQDCAKSAVAAGSTVLNQLLLKMRWWLESVLMQANLCWISCYCRHDGSLRQLESAAAAAGNTALEYAVVADKMAAAAATRGVPLYWGEVASRPPEGGMKGTTFKSFSTRVVVRIQAAPPLIYQEWISFDRTQKIGQVSGLEIHFWQLIFKTDF